MTDKQFTRLPLDVDGNLIRGEFCLKSPRNLVFISQKKTGKTLSVTNHPKILIGDCELGTKDFGFPVNNQVNILKFQGKEEFIKTTRYGWLPAGLFQVVDDLRKANDMVTYQKLYEELDEKRDETSYNNMIEHINKMPFPIFMLDTITSLIDLSNAAALHEYNESVKVENRKTDIKRVDEYSGVRYTRRKFDELKSFIENNAAPFIIYAGHIAERKKIFKKSEEDVSTIDIDLEGIQSKIFTVRASAIGVFLRNEEGCFIDFNKRDETDLGMRCAHLSNKLIKIADFISSEELEKGNSPKTYWNTIYPEIKF